MARTAASAAPSPSQLNTTTGVLSWLARNLPERSDRDAMKAARNTVLDYGDDAAATTPAEIPGQTTLDDAAPAESPTGLPEKISSRK